MRSKRARSGKRSKTVRRSSREDFSLSKKVNLLYKFVECCNCKNPSLNGLKGLVIEVTKNTLVILTIDGKIKRVLKSLCWYYVKVGDKIYLVSPRRVI